MDKRMDKPGARAGQSEAARPCGPKFRGYVAGTRTLDLMVMRALTDVQQVSTCLCSTSELDRQST